VEFEPPRWSGDVVCHPGLCGDGARLEPWDSVPFPGRYAVPSPDMDFGMI